ncbi:hypothetical protein E4T48_07403 [Aureobasidium sp. EXF-10727]|nr:hypothetical protein E4T48_07403 [Aureobasidium sp. EXF-10727]
MKTASVAAAAAAMLTTMVEAQAFTLKIRSATESLNDVPLVAWNGMFIAGYSGNSTTATCPPWDANCPGKDTTIFSGPTVDGQPTQMWMGILQEHGQRVYTHTPPKGLFESTGYGDLIGYTAAGNDDSANVPKVDTYGDLWNIKTIDNDNGLYGSKRGDRALTHGPNDYVTFDLCSENADFGGETFVLSTVSKYCSPVMVVVEETDVAAPQFYNCDGCEFRGTDLGKDGFSCSPPFCGGSNRRFLWL